MVKWTEILLTEEQATSSQELQGVGDVVLELGHEVGALQSCGQYRREESPPPFTPIVTHHIIQQPERMKREAD